MLVASYLFPLMYVRVVLERKNYIRQSVLITISQHFCINSFSNEEAQHNRGWCSI